MLRYDTSFNTEDPVEIELWAIRQGGYWEVNGQKRGHGLAYHHRAFQTLIMPKKQWHRWNELTLPYLVDPYYKLVALGGRGSSGKTHEAAFAALGTWCSNPYETTVLVSTTDTRSLELRIFGEIKKLWSMARERSDVIPGKLLSSRQAIVAENEDDDAPDFRNGIIGIPCFLSGTLVDTPDGPRPIEQIKVGDIVFNAIGTGKVIGLSSRNARQLVRVSLEDKRSVDCTPEHPFFTQRGWIKAIDLTTSDLVLSAYEAMSLLQNRHHAFVPEQEILSGLREQTSGSVLRALHQTISATAKKVLKKIHRSFLFSSVCFKMAVRTSRSQASDQTMFALWKDHDAGALQSGLLFDCVPQQNETATVRVLRNGVYFNSRSAFQTQKAFLQSILCAERTYSASSGIQADTRGIDRLGTLPRMHLELFAQDRKEVERREGALVQARSGVFRREAGRGNRWRDSSHSCKDGQGHRTNESPLGTRVDRVEILESRGQERLGACGTDHQVHNLEVEGHPSYSVDGMLVHNCMVGQTFVGLGKYVGIKNRYVILIADEASLMSDAYSKGINSLKQNPGFRVYPLANPKDRHDVFGKLCEPSNEEGGWARADNIEKTTVWNTRYSQGVFINLVGTDSPNHDPPLNRYTEFMPSVESVEESAAYYGKDSALFLMFDKGVFPKDGQSKRVLIRSECEKFRAQEDVVWEMGPTMKVVALDAAYGAVGGDRCPLIELHAGMCVDGVSRVAVANGPVIVPVRANISELPEDQIVKFTREYCEARDIQPHQVIFDGTGRSSLTSRFGQLWSSDVVAVEFGGRPSDRPVDGKLRSGPRPTDPLKTCREAYVDFVTELWMLLRVLVLADQFRQLPTEVLEELCMRVWDFQAARAITPNKTKVYVETKADMKLRFGRSPDLADSLVAGLEGMRRLGFEPGGTVIQSSNLDDVLEDMVKAQRKLRDRYALA